LDKGEPKYLNSPETPVFSKGRELYGLFEGRTAIRVAGYALVTEGYMDVVALAQLGFANAVATLGTACTAEHVQKLFRFTDSVVFSFDGDNAGRRAARKALDAALPLATDTRSVKFLFLPAEHDPDSFIRANGEAAFAQCVKEAVPLSRFLIDAAGADCDLSSAEGRARMASQARPLWSALPDGALKRQLLGDIADSTGLGSPDLLQLWQQAGVGQRYARNGGGELSGHTHEYADSSGHDRDHEPHYPNSHPTWETTGNGYGNGSGGGYQKGGGFGSKRFGKYRRGEAPPPRMLGQRLAATSRADRAVGLLLSNAQAWDHLSADDHALLAHLPSPQGPVLAWLEVQMHEHGAQPWVALREALRGHASEAYACAQVEQVILVNDPASELSELDGIMNLLRADALKALADALATRVQQGDVSAYEEFKRVTDRIKALKNSQTL
jgi:DNA primase